MKDSEARIGGHLPAVAYCATCGWSFRPYKEEERKLGVYRGRALQCPNDNEPPDSAPPEKKEEYKRRPSHLARVVQGDIGKFWLRWQRRFRNYELLYSLHRLNNHWGMGEWLRDRAGVWGLIRLGLLLVISGIVFHGGGFPLDVQDIYLWILSVVLIVGPLGLCIGMVFKQCKEARPHLAVAIIHALIIFVIIVLVAWVLLADHVSYMGKSTSPLQVLSLILAGLGVYWVLDFVFETCLVWLKKCENAVQPLTLCRRRDLSIWSFLLAVVIIFLLHIERFAALGLFLLGGLVVYLVADILISWTSAAFTRRVPASLLRSVQGLFVSYLSLVVAFATFYGFLPSCSFNVKLDWIRSLYFSLVTIVTLGYGDIYPAKNAPGAMLLVVVEVLVGLYFLAVLFTIVVGWVGAFPSESPLEVRFGNEKLFLRHPSSPFIEVRGKYCPAPVTSSQLSLFP